MESLEQYEPKPINMRFGAEKFVEVFLDKRALQVSFVQGKLFDGQKNQKSARKVVQQYNSIDEAEAAVLDIINIQLDEGYELISEDDERNDNDKQKEDNSLISSSMEEFINQIDDKCEAFNDQEKAELSGFKEDILEDCLFDNKKQKEEYKHKEENKNEEEKKLEENNNSGSFVQKELKLSSSIQVHLGELDKRAQKLGIFYEKTDDRIMMAGPKGHMFEFLAWLYEKTMECMEKEIKELKTAQIQKKQNDEYCQNEINLSSGHRMHQAEINTRAKELDLICEFAYDVLLVSGHPDNLKEFKSYLQEIEAMAKKMLYPQYWDFHEINMFSEIDVPELSAEFQQVSALFNQSLQTCQITRLTRIQNKYLMDHYVTMLQKRQEYRQDCNLNRKLLFHGTRAMTPSQIYKNSDTGFDLQYANLGAYGKGLYFAVNASYSHNGYAYNLGNGYYQMILADVFVGNPYPCKGGNKQFIKAPDGYDSVEAPESFYIIYNNFHSYPLYLIEYTVNGNNINVGFNNNQVHQPVIQKVKPIVIQKNVANNWRKNQLANSLINKKYSA